MDWCMQIAIEGPDSLSDHDISFYMETKKTQRLLLRLI